ncbi:MAG: ferrous iron transport protein B [Betaproteobacteria bacterium]|nr:ferrous iron transport protein B [Betaproteobacteria bacterium]
MRPARTPTIALAGAPNCGKTTLFNLLTGARQHVGNWPGVTVERRAGTLNLGGRKLQVVDLPGVYSLLGGGGEDQRVARDFLLDAQPDLVLDIVDASNLERHLALTAELLHAGCRVVMVLNMVDEANANGHDVDAPALQAKLGVPVVPMVARRGRGREALLRAIDSALDSAGDSAPDSARQTASAESADPPHPAPASRSALLPAALQVPCDALATALARALPHATPARLRLEALRLFEGHAQPPDAAVAAELRRIGGALRERLGEHPADLLAACRFDWAQRVASAVLRETGAGALRGRVTAALDRVALNDWFGVPLFLGVLYLVFVLSFNAGKVFQEFFDKGSQVLVVDGFGHLLLQAGLAPGWAGVLAGGIGGGVHLVVAFIPPIALTFLLLALLDDSGYMVRAAYAMDRFMRRVGLPGNALVPMVIGFGCNVPAIMGSRIVEDPRGRMLTALVQPFMSCSARLTIYMAFAAVFFRDNGGQVVFALYTLGIVAALLTAWIIGRTALRGRPTSFAVELPPYRLPSLRSVVLQSWQRLKVFVWRVGKVITAIAVVLFLLPGLGWTDSGLRVTDTQHSLLAQGSRALVPVFEPMGLHVDAWPAVSGLIAGAAAKEIVIGTLNGIYQREDAQEQLKAFREPDVGPRLLAALATIPANAQRFVASLADPLGLGALRSADGAGEASGAAAGTLARLARDFTPLSAFSYLVFVLLYVPCASTMGALRREVGWRWMAFSVAYGLLLAWTCATAIYQLGSFTSHPGSSALWLLLCAALLGSVVAVLRLWGSQGKPPRAAPGRAAYDAGAA